MIPAIEPIAKLTAQLARLPGIGSKTAQRLCYYLLGVPEAQAVELADAIREVKSKVKNCPICGSFTDEVPCAYCKDQKRDGSVLCVVQEARDIHAMERSREFMGKYHVLHGALNPMEGIGPDDIRIKELSARVQEGGVQEVILATNPDVEGEATAAYIAQLLKESGVKVTRLAHGIPIGGNLEYTDEVTIARALLGRREL